jgi:hypothetical protein
MWLTLYVLLAKHATYLPQQVGQLDIMSLGPGDMSVATAVSNIIKSVSHATAFEL